jgi:hypothetical protein
MDKIYKLLRNNQQTGPYTLEELVQMGLKPFDLIWADGLTAGWMYPSEIEVLKPFIASCESASPKVEKATAAGTEDVSPATISEPVVSPEPVKEPISVPVTATHIFISLPAGGRAAAPAAAARNVVPEPVAEEESPEQKLERRALELRQKVQAFGAQKQEADGEPTLDTKYARPLDDIKDEYSHWMHEQRSRRSQPAIAPKHWIAAALVLAVVVTGYTFIKWLTTSAAPTAQLVASRPSVVSPVQAPTTLAQKKEPEKPSVINTDISDRYTRALDKLEQANKLIAKDLKRFEGSANSTVTKPSEEVIQQDTPDVYGQEDETYAAVVNQTGTKQTNQSAEPATGTDDQRTEKTVPLGQQIDVKARYLKALRGKGIEGVELMLRNNSHQSLKTVAIDVFYYREGESLLAKETVYFNDVLPGETLTLTAPGYKKAATATYQLGLISTGEGLYVAQQ